MPLLIEYDNNEYLLSHDTIKIFTTSSFPFLSISIEDSLVIFIDEEFAGVYDMRETLHSFLPGTDDLILRVRSDERNLITSMRNIRDYVNMNMDVTHGSYFKHILHNVILEMELSSEFNINRDKSRLDLALMEYKLK